MVSACISYQAHFFTGKWVMTLACFIKFRFANFLFEAMFILNLNKIIEMCE